jgi:rhomboid family GlyGly-CTERM serine protease
MLSFPTQTRHWIVLAIIGLISIIGFFTDPVSSEWFAYNRTAISNMEIWRLFSGHFLHTNLAHLMLNLLGVALLWALHGEYYSPKPLSALLLGLTLLTSVFIFYFSPSMQWYVGLSGVLHGLFVWGAVKDVQLGEKTGVLLLIGIALKIAYEQFVGGTENIAALIQANVAVDSHLYGAISGLLLALLSLTITRRDGTAQ